MARLSKVARTQQSLLTVAQVDELVGAARRRAMLRQGLLERIARGIYRLPGSPRTMDSKILAGCLAIGPRAKASHATAMWLWGLDEGPTCRAFEYTVPTARHDRRPRLHHLTVHQTTTWGPAHHGFRRAIPVTSPARTLCDISGFRPLDEVRRAMDLAFTRRLVTLDEVQRMAAELEGRGRRRSTITELALELHRPERAECESVRQIDLLRAIEDAGLPTPVPEHEVVIDGQTWRPDLSYPDSKISIEYQGWDGHRNREAFDDDPARRNEFVGDGWKVLECTSRSDIERVIEILRRILGRAA
jgi:hypothetical protein